jgi:predicted Zn finger-like uncharacterized protein
MIINCPECTTKFLVNPTDLGEEGRMVRCGRCKNEWYAANTPAYNEQDLSPQPEPDAPFAPRHVPVLAKETKPVISRKRLLTPWRVAAASLVASVGIGVGLMANPAAVVAAWEPAAPLYAALNSPMPTVGEGLHFAQVKVHSHRLPATTKLLIDGKIINTTAKERPLPPLLFSVRDDKRKNILQWVEILAKKSIKPGEEVLFHAHRPLNNELASSLVVRFAQASEVSEEQHPNGETAPPETLEHH